MIYNLMIIAVLMGSLTSNSNIMPTISPKGIELIKEYEGLRLKPYNDVGRLAIGYGHTGYVTKTMNITEERAAKLLYADLVHIQKQLRLLISVSVTQNQFDALVSFVYNVGVGAFKRSVLLKELNSGNYTKAANELHRWVYANGVKLAGLVRRRQAEFELFTN